MKGKRNAKIRSIRDITVFGMSVPTQLSNDIWYGRASRSDRLKAYLSTASSEQKKDFFDHFCTLQSTLLDYLAESESLVLVFDNTTLQDLLQKGEKVQRRARYNSLLALLIEAEDYHLIEVLGAITPVILYEANGCRPIQDVTTWNRIGSELSRSMVDIGLYTTYIGFNNFGQLFHIHKSLVADEKQIRQAIEKIKASKWSLDLPSLDSGRLIGLSVAEENVPNIGLQYLDAASVKSLLMQMIESNIGDEKSNRRVALTTPIAERPPSILKLKGGKLTGLGDVELLSECALAAQVYRKQPFLRMAVSADDRLNRILSSRTTTVLHGPFFKGGTDPVQSAASMAYMWRRERRKLAKVNARAKEHREQAIAFMNEHLEELQP